MEKVPLLEYARKNGQHRTAKDLKISQGAVSKAINSGRNICRGNPGIPCGTP